MINYLLSILSDTKYQAATFENERLEFEEKIRRLDLEKRNQYQPSAASYSPLDKYKLIKPIGAGSYGQVFLVVDTQLKLPEEEAQLDFSFFNYYLIMILKNSLLTVKR